MTNGFKCLFCGEIAFDARIGKGPVYYTLKIQQRLVNATEVRKLAGMTLFFGGTPEAQGLAQVMTGIDDSKLTIPMGGQEHVVCQDCAIKVPILMLWTEQEESEDENEAG